VAAIPPSCFYVPQDAHLAANYARFCFAKDDKVRNATITTANVRKSERPFPPLNVSPPVPLCLKDLDAAAVQLKRLQQLPSPREAAM
jgi:hypothetical protein